MEFTLGLELSWDVDPTWDVELSLALHGSTTWVATLWLSGEGVLGFVCAL